MCAMFNDGVPPSCGGRGNEAPFPNLQPQAKHPAEEVLEAAGHVLETFAVVTTCERSIEYY